MSDDLVEELFGDDDDVKESSVVEDPRPSHAGPIRKKKEKKDKGPLAPKAKKSQGPLGKRWCFTVYEGSWPDLTKPIEFQPDIMGYLVYQLEKCPNTQNLHFQGYVEFKKQLYGTGIKKLGPPWHTCKTIFCDGSGPQNKVYCLKEESRVEGGLRMEHGTMSKTGVTRAYTVMVNALLDGTFSTETHAHEYIKHKRNVDEFIRERRSVKPTDLAIPDIVLKPWQTDIVSIISQPPHDRAVYWYYDTIGGAGKSTFTKYLLKHHGALCISTTAKDRVIRAYDHQPVVILDLTREEGQQGAINYSVLEMLKNGFGFNTMYEPGQKCWQVPHVFVFSNFPPDQTKLSADRWRINDITCTDMHPTFAQNQFVSE